MKLQHRHRMFALILTVTAASTSIPAGAEGGLFSILNYQTDFEYQSRIAQAYLSYVEKNHLTPPASLKVLVEAGLLPEKGKLYGDATKLIQRSVPYTESVYVIFPFSPPVTGYGLNFIARQESGNPGKLTYHPVINATIRDGLVALFRKAKPGEPSLHKSD